MCCLSGRPGPGPAAPRACEMLAGGPGVTGGAWPLSRGTLALCSVGMVQKGRGGRPSLQSGQRQRGRAAKSGAEWSSRRRRKCRQPMLPAPGAPVPRQVLMAAWHGRQELEPSAGSVQEQPSFWAGRLGGCHPVQSLGSAGAGGGAPQRRAPDPAASCAARPPRSRQLTHLVCAANYVGCAEVCVSLAQVEAGGAKRALLQPCGVEVGGG